MGIASVVDSLRLLNRPVTNARECKQRRRSSEQLFPFFDFGLELGSGIGHFYVYVNG